MLLQIAGTESGNSSKELSDNINPDDLIYYEESGIKQDDRRRQIL